MPDSVFALRKQPGKKFPQAVFFHLFSTHREMLLIGELRLKTKVWVKVLYTEFLGVSIICLNGPSFRKATPPRPPPGLTMKLARASAGVSGGGSELFVRRLTLLARFLTVESPVADNG